MPTPPTPADALAYFTSAGGSGQTEASITKVLTSETAAQLRVVRLPVDPDPEAPEPYPADLAEALLRRVVRNLFMRGVPSGLQSGGEGSFTVRVGSDPEVRRLEAPWRRLPKG